MTVSGVVLAVGILIVLKLFTEVVLEGRMVVALASAGASIMYPSVTLSVLAVARFHE